MTNTISSMVFTIRPRLLLETRLVLEIRLLLEQRQSDPWLVLETRLVFEIRLLLEEIRYLICGLPLSKYTCQTHTDEATLNIVMGSGSRDSPGARKGHLTTGLLQHITGQSARGNYRTSKTATELGGSLNFRAEHLWACHAMFVTVALATSTLACPVQTVLRYALVFHGMCPAFLSNIVEPVGAQAVHVPDYVPPRRRTSRCHGCAQSSVNIHLATPVPLCGTTCLKICVLLQTQRSSDNSWRLTFLLELLMFSDFRPSVTSSTTTTTTYEL